MKTIEGEGHAWSGGSTEGLVDGIAVEGAESSGTNSMAETLVLPLACVRDRILAVVPDDESAEILKIFGSADDLALRNAFQPSANVRRRFSNLRLAKALSGWIAERNKNRQLPPLVDRQHMPQVMPIIVDRRLGYVLLVEFQAAAATTRSQFSQTYVEPTSADLWAPRPTAP
jgi:hypothetical protein